MANGPSLEERFRSFSDQVRAQQQEIARLQQVINQRSVNVAVETIEGLGQLIDQAERGDANCVRVLSLLADRLDRVRAAASRIALPPSVVRLQPTQIDAAPEAAVRGDPD